VRSAAISCEFAIFCLHAICYLQFPHRHENLNMHTEMAGSNQFM
jgi:hypothetical protein